MMQGSHSHRHEAMQIKFVSEMEADALLTHPFEPGSCTRYTVSTQEAKKVQSTKSFGCRHCLRKTDSSVLGAARPSSSDMAAAVEQAPEVVTINCKKLMEFHGLVSHVKAKFVLPCSVIPDH